MIKLTSLLLIIFLVCNPVILIIILIPKVLEQILEQSPQVGIVWLVLKLQGSAIRTILDKFIWETLAKVFNFGHNFLFLDLLILLLKKLLINSQIINKP